MHKDGKTHATVNWYSGKQSAVAQMAARWCRIFTWMGALNTTSLTASGAIPMAMPLLVERLINDCAGIYNGGHPLANLAQWHGGDGLGCGLVDIGYGNEVPVLHIYDR